MDDYESSTVQGPQLFPDQIQALVTHKALCSYMCKLLFIIKCIQSLDDIGWVYVSAGSHILTLMPYLGPACLIYFECTYIPRLYYLCRTTLTSFTHHGSAGAYMPIVAPHQQTNLCKFNQIYINMDCGVVGLLYIHIIYT